MVYLTGHNLSTRTRKGEVSLKSIAATGLYSSGPNRNNNQKPSDDDSSHEERQPQPERQPRVKLEC